MMLIIIVDFYLEKNDILFEQNIIGFLWRKEVVIQNYYRNIFFRTT